MYAGIFVTCFHDAHSIFNFNDDFIQSSMLTVCLIGFINATTTTTYVSEHEMYGCMRFVGRTKLRATHRLK